MKPSKPGFGKSPQNGPSFNRKSGSTTFSRHPSICGFSGIVKRAIDVSVTAFVLVLLSPLMVLIALAIRMTDGGTVLFRQVRVGLDRRRFTMIKYRTMNEDAERYLGAIWAVPGDPRCTRVGRLLRRTGLDELPQLWNVLRGDMSIIGPRPERPEFIRDFRKEHFAYDLRHVVLPGIIGYAQIHGWRGFTSLEERLRHDIYYVRNWSLMLDVYILVMATIRGWSTKTRRGA